MDAVFAHTWLEEKEKQTSAIGNVAQEHAIKHILNSLVTILVDMTDRARVRLSSHSLPFPFGSFFSFFPSFLSSSLSDISIPSSYSCSSFYSSISTPSFRHLFHQSAFESPLLFTLPSSPAHSHPFAMGIPLSKAIAKIFGNKEMRILMLGLDAAGKTSTCLYVSFSFPLSTQS